MYWASGRVRVAECKSGGGAWKSRNPLANPDRVVSLRAISLNPANRHSVAHSLLIRLFLCRIIDRLIVLKKEMESVTVKSKRPSHMNGTRVPGKEKVSTRITCTRYISNGSVCQLTCEECQRRGVSCGGVWRFHSQHGKYLQQCRECRLKKRACPFRRFENGSQASPKKRAQATKGKKHRHASTPISISDSESSEEDAQVAGPSSRPEKKVRVKSAGGWDKLKDTLLVARKRKVEIETEAEIELAKINSIIKEAERDLWGTK